MYDITRIREDFPILQRIVRGKPLVYLDSAASSQRPRQVVDAITSFYETSNANIHRGVHTLSDEATDAYENARAKVAAFIGAPEPQSCIFVRNTTEAINLVAHSWGRYHLKPGDEILLTEMEHHSNIVPWQLVARDTGAVLRYAPITDEGTIDLDVFEQHLSPRTKIVSVAHMSNVLGTINPVDQIARMAHAVGAIVVVDGAQSVPHLPVDVTAIGCDFMAFSGHKMLGPTGIGILYGKLELLDEMEPYQGGGSMISVVEHDMSTWAPVPMKFEAGTPHIAGAVGLGAAVDYLNSLGMEAVRQHEIDITRYALRALAAVPEVEIHGPEAVQQRGGVISFTMGDVHPHDIGTILDEHGIAIRAGHHCAQPLMRRLGVGATARASFYVYTTEQEVDALVGALEHAREIFGRVYAR